MKKVSIYVQSGKSSAVTYYRFSQFLDNMEISVKYNKMIPDERVQDFLPISKQTLFLKFYIFLYIFVRVTIQLINDLFFPPDLLIISRRLIHRILPAHFLFLLLLIKLRKTKILWDFDDQIISLREISRRGFDKFSLIADIIIIGNRLLKNLVKDVYRNKEIIYMPTTDGDMYGLVTEKTLSQREKEMASEIKIVWVGTFSGLDNLIKIMPAFEMFGMDLAHNNKRLKLSIVCDSPLNYCAKHFILDNVKWERQVAVKKMLEAHIGIMPLENSEITRGKCGFKLIQYLSVGLPIIGSAVGMNNEVISEDVGCSLQRLDPNLWRESFSKITSNVEEWRHYCRNSLNRWVKYYSYDANFITWKSIIDNI